MASGRAGPVEPVAAAQHLSGTVHQALARGHSRVEAKISELTQQERRLLEEETSALERLAAGHDPELTLDQSTSDLAVLQSLCDEGILDRRSTVAIRRLGIAFGRVLERGLHLRWVMVEDEYGHDPALREGDTSLVLYPLRVVERQLADSAAVNFPWLYKSTKEYVENLRRFAPSQLRRRTKPRAPRR